MTPEPPATRAVLVTGGGTGIGAAVDAGTLPYDPRVEIRREPERPERDR